MTYSKLQLSVGTEMRRVIRHHAADLDTTATEFVIALVLNYVPERDEDKVRATIQQHHENKQAPPEPSIS